MGNNEEKKCQLAVIGSGMAGVAASSFASCRGVETIMVGGASELSFATGCLDLFGASPFTGKKDYINPWKGIDSLLNINSAHPYSNLPIDSIMSAFSEFSGFLSSSGLGFHSRFNKNSFIITPAGTLKPTFAISSSMAAGSDAVTGKKRILIAGIKGLKGFCPDLISSGLKKYNIDSRAGIIEFPGKENHSELNCERMAWDLDTGNVFELFAHSIESLVTNEEVVGIPAVLGIYNSEKLRKSLEKRLNMPVFEIPVFSPSVTGLRFKERAFEKLREKGVSIFQNTKIKNIERDEDKNFVFNIENSFKSYKVKAENLILASGRFFGGGLVSSGRKISESLMDIDITQSENWYEKDFFSSHGHEITRCGIKTDRFFRPVDDAGNIYDQNLYAAGSILANQDWKREKSGSGIALTSAYAAVSALSRSLWSSPGKIKKEEVA